MWVKTVKGSLMPVNIEPHICAFQVPGEFWREPMEKPVIVFRDQLAVVVRNNEEFTAHTCHFDTCPNADQYRKST